jgi:TolB protein
MEKISFPINKDDVQLAVTKNIMWKAVAAVSVLTVIALGGFALAGRMRRGPVPAPVKQGPVAPATVPGHGIILFQSRVDGFWQIFSLDLSSGARTRLTQSQADDNYPSASPDGSWIVFESTRDGSKAVWRMRADGTGVERLTDLGRECTAPSWDGGGSSILYNCPQSGREQLFILELNTRRERRLTNSFWPSILPAVPPDGSAIAFSRNKLGWDVYRMNPDGSGVTALTSKGGNCRPDWSPDGKRIAFVSDVADGKGDVWTMDANGGDKVRVTTGDDSYDYNPAWSPDGRWIVYETTKGSKNGPWSLAVIPAGGGTPALLTPAGADDRYPDWAPEKDSR